MVALQQFEDVNAGDFVETHDPHCWAEGLKGLLVLLLLLLLLLFAGLGGLICW